MEEKDTASGLNLGRRGSGQQNDVRHYRRGNTSSKIDGVGEGVHRDAMGSQTGHLMTWQGLVPYPNTEMAGKVNPMLRPDLIGKRNKVGAASGWVVQKEVSLFVWVL